ncbi:MAG: hypothetical protein WEF50_20960 [Myxococcota bacterium]
MYSESVCAPPPRAPIESSVGSPAAAMIEPSVTPAECTASGVGRRSSAATSRWRASSSRTSGVSGFGERCNMPHRLALVPAPSFVIAICSSLRCTSLPCSISS